MAPQELDLNRVPVDWDLNDGMDWGDSIADRIGPAHHELDSDMVRGDGETGTCWSIYFYSILLRMRVWLWSIWCHRLVFPCVLVFGVVDGDGLGVHNQGDGDSRSHDAPSGGFTDPVGGHGKLNTHLFLAHYVLTNRIPH